MKTRVLACLGAIVLLAGGTAWAATDTDTLTVTANVISSAQITGVGNIDFGDYDPSDATPLDADGSVSVRATVGLNYQIYISADRSMTGGSDTLNYELYSDAGRTTVWGSELAGAEDYTSTGNTEVTYSIYGRVPALQDVGPNAYSDTVQITLNW
jgi:spore coat protein U-like protein